MEVRFARLLVAAAVFLAARTVAHAADPSSSLRLNVVDGIEFVADHQMDADRLADLASHVRDVEHRLQVELGVPPVEPRMRFYLFSTQTAFSRYVQLHVPSVGRRDTAGRHGIFLLRQGRPYVFLSIGDDLVQSLRHETVHAVLNTSHPKLPIWIDEGLAQCYEATDGTHWSDRAAKVSRDDLLRRDTPKATSLAKLRTMSQLGPREYAGAWANMRYLLNDETKGRSQLTNYLKSLRDGTDPPAIAESIPPLGRMARRD